MDALFFLITARKRPAKMLPDESLNDKRSLY
jgi:hypothetical protein